MHHMSIMSTNQNKGTLNNSATQIRTESGSSSQHTGADGLNSQSFCLWEHLSCAQILPNWPSAVYSFSLQFC